ncbi:MAG: DNA polymerase III subunit alpha [Acidobacteria bacterium]|nr:DNA polymerase III subunit alpha [Acidobacteriota bacterium]
MRKAVDVTSINLYTNGVPYIPLLNHSFHSLLDSALSPQTIVEAAAQWQLPAIGLTDTDTLSGAVQFYKAARAAGLHPIIGSQVHLADRSTIVLLIENSTGYRNLCRLLTTLVQHPEGVLFQDLASRQEGLICLLGPDSEPARMVRRGEPRSWGEAAERRIAEYSEIFGRNLALALAPHNEDDLRLSRQFATFGRRLRIPLVAAAEAHYLAPAGRLQYDILASMRTLTLLEQTHPEKRGPGHYHLHSPEEIQRHFGGLPQAIENTWRIAGRCRFDFELGDIRFPRFPLPEGESALARLRRLAEEGIRRRYGAQPRAETLERLERELSVIGEVGYAEYFLIFHDIVIWANARGIETLARGSAAGSLVCYALGISNVCPFRFGLSFERFLNRERMQFQKLADIDLDLPWDKRDQVVQYVFERYGHEHVAMIGAFNTFQGRAAIADIAKVFGIPEREVRRFTERLPHFSGDAEAAVREQPECRDLPCQEEPYRTVLRMVTQFQGIPRHRMMHPCGLVISADPVADHMPVFESAKGLLTTHYDMDDVEELGLLKMDLLGQAGLSVLREARDNLRENRGLDPDLHTACDWKDAATWETIATGQARGVFHIESPAMTSLLVMTNCRDIDCLTAVESIIRPGAANEGKKRAFARRHQGLEPVSYVHPSLEPLLADTYGLMAYEEHILLVANGFAGMPWGRADILRRTLVKNKDRKRIVELGAEFREYACKNGRSEEETAAVWRLVEDFAGYMFNKAHSAAYAVEAFQGAWFKTRYPVEFLASVLSNRRGFYAPILYVLEALRCGARFLPPDVRLSDGSRFLVRAETIRLPLNQIKGLGQDLADRIVKVRPFANAGEFFRKVKPQRAEWMALLKTGALDGFEEPRGRLFWRFCRLEAALPRRQQESALFETSSPDSGFDNASPSPRWEHELLGFPVSVHPLEYFGPPVDWSRYVTAEALRRHPQRYFGKEVQVCGLIVADRIHPTDRGPMKFLTLADYTGFVEVSLFAEAYQAYGHLTVQPVVAVTAVADPADNHKGCALNGMKVSLPAETRTAARR